MRTLLTSILVMGFVVAVQAQYRITLVLNSLPPAHSNELPYIAASFNGWNPGSANHRFSLADGRLQLQLLLPAGTYEYKFTRGSWDKVESTAAGSDIGNRTLAVTNDTLLEMNIAGWKDDGNTVRPNTASANVSILSDSFYMPQLNRKRRIWLYLPPGYASSTQRYPVLYMHDGQNLFTTATAPFGEWGIDECWDSLAVKSNRSCIIVGIDHGGDKRMQEYNPYAFAQFGSGEGAAYTDFLVQTLKPAIDKQYRTLPDRSNTFVAGSSMGGLISMYATLRYPQVFGGAGIFSPAFWTAPALDAYIDSLPGRISARLFFYAGGSESKDMLPDMWRIADKTALKSDYFIYAVTDEAGRHNEPAWRTWLPVFNQWLLNNRAE